MIQQTAAGVGVGLVYTSDSAEVRAKMSPGLQMPGETRACVSLMNLIFDY